MVTKHLTDDEVQQYAVDELNCERRIAEHIHFCGECRMKAEVYRLMVTGIKQQPSPAFDFDLSATVLNQLPMAIRKTSNDRLLTWIIIFICAGLLGGVLYFFRNYLDNMFKGVPSISIYLMGVSALTVISWMFVEMYKKYQKEMRILDLC
ncbi:MAG TPA: hypothetical protein VF144_03615 [Chitinophagaceae bacterium]